MEELLNKLEVAGWEILEGEAMVKACQVLGADPEGYSFPDAAKKFGRKTVFYRYHGIFTLSAVGANGLVSEKFYTSLPSDSQCWLVALMACGWTREEALRDHRVMSITHY